MIKNILVLKKCKAVIFIAAAIAHVVLILTVTVSGGEKEEREDNTVFKMVDVQEYVPPQPIKEEPPKPPPKKIIKETQVEVKQDEISEEIIETEKEVIKIEEAAPESEVINFVPQHKVSDPPGIPTSRILEKIVYPTLANKQKIEGVVYLELYIDTKGRIRKIEVLKDPGYGLADAALDALDGVICKPAMANGKAVAVRFRYPVRFKLK